MKLKILKVLGCTSHSLSAQKPHVVSGCYWTVQIQSISSITENTPGQPSFRRMTLAAILEADGSRARGAAGRTAGRLLMRDGGLLDQSE